MNQSPIQFSADEADWAQNVLRSCTMQIQYRGHQYYKANLITDIRYQRKSGSIRAEVQGSELYQVTIFPYADEYGCDCPSQVFPCKHIAAVCHFIVAHSSDQIPSSADLQLLRKMPRKPEPAFAADNIISYKTAETQLALVFNANFFAPRFMPLSDKGEPPSGYFMRVSTHMQEGQRNFLMKHGIDPEAISITQAPLESQVLAILRASLADQQNPDRIPLFIEDSYSYHPLVFQGELSFHLDHIITPENDKIIILPYATNTAGKIYPIAQHQVAQSFALIFSHSKTSVIAHNFLLSELADQHLKEKAKELGVEYAANDHVNTSKPCEFFVASLPAQSKSIPVSLLGVQSLNQIALKLKIIAPWLPENLVKKFQNIFESEPVLMLSVFHEKEDREIEYKVCLQYAYLRTNQEKEILLNSDAEEIFSESKIATFAGVRHTSYNQEAGFICLSHEGILVNRNRLAEITIRQKIRAPASIDSQTGLINFADRDIEQWLLNNLRAYREAGVVVRMRKDLAELFALKCYKSRMQILSSSGIDWFSAMFTIEGLTPEEQAQVIKAAKKKNDLIKLSTGKWINLKESGIAEPLETLEALGIKPDAEGRIPFLTQGMVASLMYEKFLETRADAAVEKLKMRLIELQKPVTQQSLRVSGRLRTVLHEYQHEGVNFFARLYRFSLGGILADDMGLGKTVQTLAFLDAVFRKNKNARFLVIAPLAALAVWENEANKFTPNLPVHIWHGSVRKQKVVQPGILVTTFQTMLKDVSYFEKIPFEVMVLDEAQNAKNLNTEVSKMLRKLKVRSIFCLTGTPIENRLDDLFALFDLFFPGFLGEAKAFKKKSLSDKYDLPDLKKKIAPFILRRTKEAIMPNLPAKTEYLLASGMTTEQTVIYERARQKAEEAVLNGHGSPLFEKLRHLTILRRIACHPYCSLPESGWQLSGKFLFFSEKIKKIAESSNGFLIFSQFTGVLAFIKKILDEASIDYFYLDGKTTPQKRRLMTDHFQNGQKKAFLISLKAGGVALTLTRADTVIILDPWWNPAVERQAIDRTHRIGQTKPIKIYRLISKATVEEKVIILQEGKKELFNSIFDKEGSYHRPITEKEINQLLA